MTVVVNEMDGKTVNCSEKRHNEIEMVFSNLLKRTGFNPDKNLFVTISWFNGDNMIERSKNVLWYKGQCSSRRLTSPGPCPAR